MSRSLVFVREAVAADAARLVDLWADLLRRGDDHDNLADMEQVIEAAPVLSVLLGQCEGLWVLATSRERLRLRGEWEVRIDPLVPEGGEVR